MNTPTHPNGNDMATLVDDACALVSATADVAGEKVAEARQRLAVAVENAKRVAGCVREKAVQTARAADEVVHEHPYKAIAVGVGLGAIIGFFIARRCSSNGD